jgi:aspartate-semialdehyde dehydrogenase
MPARLEVGVLGATGVVGQQFVARLSRHPWFQLRWLAASERSEGRRYEEAAAWRLAQPIPADAADLPVEGCTPGVGPKVVFSALDAGVAGEIEAAFAAAGHVVVSNARNHRLDPLVPLLVPEINAAHLDLLREQAASRSWKGALVTNPNCSTVFLAMVLAALRGFSPRAAIVTTLQAVSGAGYPGLPSLDILGNVVPYISGEEEKLEVETRKILGDDGGRRPHPVAISAQATRVGVLDGHTESISVALQAAPPVEEVKKALAAFSGPPQELGLPTAPARPIEILAAPDRPQPRLDALRGDGMSVSVGRVRACPVLSVKLVALGHNTVRGAAGAAILNGELMHARGLLS